MCYTLLPDNRELVLVDLAYEADFPIYILSLGEYRFMSFVGWDRGSIDARIGFLAQN